MFKRMWRAIPRTTVGRFWGYVGVALALGVSLAGNVAAAYLRGEDPSWVELCFAGIPPAVAFIAIEIVNHNPWAEAPWGAAVTKVMLFVVAPGAAIVSFIHLTTVAMAGDVVMPDRMETILKWTTAVLTALLIDGLILGATGALLLPKGKVKGPATGPTSVQTDLRPFLEEKDRLVKELAKVTQIPPRPKTITATLAKQPTGDRKRFKPGEHPLWDAWLTARGTESPWTPEDMQREMKALNRDVTLPAAAQQIRRWTAQVSSNT